MQGLINVLEKKNTLKDIAIVNVMKEVGDRYYFFFHDGTSFNSTRNFKTFNFPCP
jgi:hypothetical protein